MQLLTTHCFQGRRSYTCADSPGAPNGCACLYDSPLAAQCQIPGELVLKQYGYETGDTGKWIGIMLGIIVVSFASNLHVLTT